MVSSQDSFLTLSLWLKTKNQQKLLKIINQEKTEILYVFVLKFKSTLFVSSEQLLLQ